MATINDIKTLVNTRGGFARPNRFVVEFAGVQGIINEVDSSNNSVKDLNILVDSISIPGRTINSFEYAIWNHSIKVPTGYDEDDIEIVFNVTNDFLSKKIMDAWLAKVINQRSYYVSYDDDYKKNFKIFQLNERDEKVFGVELVGAYPVSVKGLFLDNNSESSVSRFSATFTFNRYIPADITKNPIGRPLASYYSK
jgi:hypothetical protein